MKRHHLLNKAGFNRPTHHAIILAVVTSATVLATGCFGFGSNPCEDLEGDSRRQADACYGTWTQGQVFEEPTGVYSLQYIDHDHYDPTDEWFDTCRDDAWTREFVIIEHASGSAARPSPEDRVVYHERRACAWNIRCFASDTLLRNDVTMSSGTNPIAGLELNCDR